MGYHRIRINFMFTAQPGVPSLAWSSQPIWDYKSNPMHSRSSWYQLQTGDFSTQITARTALFPAPWVVADFLLSSSVTVLPLRGICLACAQILFSCPHVVRAQRLPHTCTYSNACTHTQVYMHVYEICVYTHMHASTTHMHVHKYAHMHIYTCTHISAHTVTEMLSLTVTVLVSRAFSLLERSPIQQFCRFV